MNRVLETTREVSVKSRQVRINQDVVREFCSNLDEKDISYWQDAMPFQTPDLDDENRLNFIFIMNAVNFCYWGEPKWTIDYRGKKLDGAWAMIASLQRAWEDGTPIFNASYLEGISEQEVAEVLNGKPQIPLFRERVKILREVGAVLNKKYQGKFVNLVESASEDAVTLLDILVKEFPSYYDSAEYEGTEIVFHKRAQLAIADVYRTFSGKKYGGLRNVDALTAFADYKIPQSLRKLGIMQYADDLAHKVDMKIELPAGSQEEIEIRAGQIWAVEYMKETLRQKIPGVKSIDLDSWLWLQGQHTSPDDKPYHRTRTICY